MTSAPHTRHDRTAKRKPTIRYGGGTLPESMRAAETALMKSGTSVYQRGGQLVRVVTSRQPSKKPGERGHEVRIEPVTVPWLRLAMSDCAAWKRRTNKGLEPINAPREVAESYVSAVGEWQVPELTGIVETPTLRPNGSVLNRPGYDESTGLLFIAGRLVWPAIPANPTRDEGLSALSVLRDLVKDFPFETPADESVAISAILTALVRRSLRTAPLHAFAATKMGTGKSLLSDVCGWLASGRGASLLAPTVDPNEERKRILSALRSGDSVVCVDNVEAPWGSDAMCVVLTQPSYTDRVLGESRTVTLPTSVLWCATGNNLQFRGDLSTRVLRCSLDAQSEHPEHRRFDRYLPEYVPKHRVKLVTAALTVLRAYAAAGRPPLDLEPYGRFEDYDKMVRAPLCWLGMEDPCRTRDAIEDADPVRRKLKALLSAWHTTFGERPVTVAQAISETVRREALRDALEELALDRGTINARIVGNTLRKYERRIESGLRIEAAGTHRHAVLWRVTRVQGAREDNPPVQLSVAL